MEPLQPTESERLQLEQAKRGFPFRIVYLAKNVNGESDIHLDYDRRRMNRFIREGWSVWEPVYER